MDEATADEEALSKRGTTEGQFWTAMRSLKAFSAADVMHVVKLPINTENERALEKYIKILRKAQYVTEVKNGPHSYNPPQYRLVRNTGNLPPITQRAEVLVDQNLDKGVYAPEVRL